MKKAKEKLKKNIWETVMKTPEKINSIGNT